MVNDGVLRIGELSKRTGVSPELLRAWERRCELLNPTRTPRGLRLYTTADVERVHHMQEQLAHGLAAAGAAAHALRPTVGPEPDAPAPAALRDHLADARVHCGLGVCRRSHTRNTSRLAAGVVARGLVRRTVLVGVDTWPRTIECKRCGCDLRG